MNGDEGAEVVTLQEAADLLRVHYMTAYRWVRQGDLPAFKAGGRLRIQLSDVERFKADRAVDVAGPGASTSRTDWPLHVERLHEAIAQGASAEASALVRKVMADGAPALDVYVHLLTPVLHRVGDDWADGRLNVAEEHRATQIAATILGRLGGHFRRRGPSRGRVVTLTPAGEQHGLATIMLSDVLRGGGYEVHQLGPDVPAVDLDMLMHLTSPTAICVSITRDDLPSETLEDLVSTVRQHEGARCVMGGQGISADGARTLGAGHLDDIRELAGALRS